MLKAPTGIPMGGVEVGALTTGTMNAARLSVAEVMEALFVHCL